MEVHKNELDQQNFPQTVHAKYLDFSHVKVIEGRQLFRTKLPISPLGTPRPPVLGCPEISEQEDEFMKKVSLSIISAAAVVALGITTYLVAANDTSSHTSHSSVAKSADITGPLSNETVSFGAWMTSPPLDRFPNVSNTRLNNHHVVIPEVARIKVGGTVNFIIAGFHQVAIYDDGTQPDDIDISITVLPTNPPQPPPQLIADPNRRIYRGPDPSLLPPDRVEVVHFDKPGTYLVICAVLPHFQSGMFGYVKVVPGL